MEPELNILLEQLSVPSIRNLIFAVTDALIEGQSIPKFSGEGGFTSDLPWDDRRPNEEENEYHRRCLLHASRVVKSIRGGYRSDYVETHTQKSSFKSEAWSILSDIEQSIKYKVESIGVPLKKWDVEICRGVLTGWNDAFIVTSEKRNEILANCIDDEERKRTAELIRPILRGRDIKRYCYEWADLWDETARDKENSIHDILPELLQVILPFRSLIFTK